MKPAASPPSSMENPRPQLSLIELRQLRWFLGGLIGVLSAWTVFHLEVDALVVLAILTLVVPVFTVYPRLSTGLPAMAHRLAFPVIVALFAFDLWSGRDPLPAMIRLALMLLCYRCVAPRSRREDLQLILLALFLVVVTGVYTVSMAFVAQILLFTAAALALLLAVTLSDSRVGGGGAVAPGGPPADSGWERVRWRELFGRVRAAADPRVLILCCGLFGGLVALSALLFIALPRFEISNDFFLDRLITRDTRTGFSDSISFQDVVNIQQDTSVAMMVDVSDPAAVPADPYWRMLVLDEYSGRGFRVSPVLLSTFPSVREKVHAYAGNRRDAEDQTVWTVYFQPGVSRYLPLMGDFTRLVFGEPQALKRSAPLRVVALTAEPAKMVAYRVEGMAVDGVLRDRDFAREGKLIVPVLDYWTGGESVVEDPTPRAVTYLELALEREQDMARLREWAEEIGGIGEGGADFARRAAAWLQARHAYSLSMRLEQEDGDPLVRWMASTQPGHCEMFAGSLVLLARAAGVPARLVTGFKGGAWNSTSGSITVRNSDAHAWAEVWDEGRRAWLRADATPGAQITPGGSRQAAGASALEQDRGWGARLDGLRVFWYRQIVNFDEGSRRDLMRRVKDVAGTVVKDLREAVEERLRAAVEWVRSPWDFPRVARICLAVGTAAALGVFWRRAGRAWWLGWRSRRAASHRRDPVRIEASRWLARLERAERARPGAPGETKSAVRAARERLLRLRFGAREGWAPPATVFREAKQAARSLSRARRQR
jgi:hypothetical protein